MRSFLGASIALCPPGADLVEDEADVAALANFHAVANKLTRP